MILLPKIVLAGTVLASAAGVLWQQHQHNVRGAQANAQLRTDLEQLRRAAEDLRQERDTADAELAARRAELALAQVPANPRAPESIDSSSEQAVQAASPEAAYVTLSKANLKRFGVQPFTDEFRLTDPVASLLGMSTAEREAVNRIVEKLITQHQEMDLARIEAIEEHLTSEPGRKTSFRVAAYAEEGQVLAEEALLACVQVLGSDRTELLLHYADLNSVSTSSFDPFGRMQKTITFLDRLNEDGSRGHCRIYLRIEDKANGIIVSSSFTNDDDKIPLNWRHLIRNIDLPP